MKAALLALFFSGNLFATTISVIPVHQPVSLHGTDVDDIISGTDEVLQATVLSRPMALTGAFPEVLVESIATPYKIPSNNPNYTVEETNLLVLCGVTINAQLTDEGLLVRLNIARLSIPQEVDLTSRQLLKITLVALQRTLEEYHRPQPQALKVIVAIEGTTDKNASLTDLQATFTLEPKP